ncbi:MAG: molybdopterin cofactor-binding domain-containing protein [Bacteroidota bacterium]
MTDKKTKKGSMKRRAFLITGGLLGGGVVVGIGGLTYVNKKIKQYTATGFEGEMMNAWVSVTPDNVITLAVPRAEMGQGVSTSVPMLIAEELEVDLDQIRTIHPQPESPYANTQLITGAPRDLSRGITLQEKVAQFVPVVGTGGSTTITDGWEAMRMVGAQAREMFVSAAAARWEVPKADCYVQSGSVYHKGSGRNATYGELVDEAKNFASDDLVQLKDEKDFKLIGTSAKRLDIPEKVTGEASYGLDVRPEGIRYAVIKHPSVTGGEILSVSNEEEVLAMKGVEKVALIPQGVAIIADNTWRARNASLVIEVEEDHKGNDKIDDEYINDLLDEAIHGDAIATHEDVGDVSAVFTDQKTNVEGVYGVPYLAHATMEPLNCTIRLNEDKSADVWVGHQAPSVAVQSIAKVLGIPKANVKIHIQYLGGGFGRRAENDVTYKAAEVAKQMPGVPIQLVFTREEDMTNDMYRPGAKSKMSAVVDPDGTIRAWDSRVAIQSVMQSSMSRIMPMMAPKPKDDVSTTEGLIHLPYLIPNKRVAFGDVPLPMAVGFWRSVGNSQNAFFSECFMDECAHAASQDPYLFRKTKMSDHPRYEAVLDRVAEMSDWGNTPEGSFHGMAILKSFGSIVAQVAQISRVGEKSFSIDKYYCAVDCGRTVHPDTIKSQMEGGIIFGLSAALYGEITFSNGSVQQQNFPQYDMVRMKVSPVTEVSILDVDAYPGGVGEPGTPPAAPALCNAIFAASGDRVRQLPLIKLGYEFV